MSSELRKKGYEDATEGRDIAREDDREYMKGYREGLVKQLEWAVIGVTGFDRDFPGYDR